MRKTTIILFLALPFLLFAQVITHTTGTIDLDTDFSVRLDFVDPDQTVFVTMIGPSDKYLAVGFGSLSKQGSDVLVYESDVSGVEQLRDMGFSGQTTPIEDTQDWTLNNNVVSNGIRTIEASRNYSTQESFDYTFSVSVATLNLIWAKGTSLELGNHSSSDRGATTATIQPVSTLGNEDDYKTKTPQFSMSPNPSSKTVNITVNDSFGKAFKLEVFDVLGKQIYRELLTSDRTSLDVSGWRVGVYLVKVTTENTSKTKRFVKQ